LKKILSCLEIFYVHWNIFIIFSNKSYLVIDYMDNHPLITFFEHTYIKSSHVLHLSFISSVRRLILTKSELKSFVKYTYLYVIHLIIIMLTLRMWCTIHSIYFSSCFLFNKTNSFDFIMMKKMHDMWYNLLFPRISGSVVILYLRRVERKDTRQ